MNEKKAWLTVGIVSFLIAGGAGFAIYTKRKDIDETEASIAKLHTDIDTARRTIEGTSDLEREVIVLRELAGAFEQILPNGAEVTNLIQNFYRYSGEAGVEPTSFKPKTTTTRGRTATDFDKVAYTLTLSGDTFQFLEFLDRIETHSRFMAVPSFKLTSSSRTDMEKFGYAKHKIQLDVETFVYQPKRQAKNVSIEGYNRKRDLLAGEINRRRQALTLSTFNYRGARGRRDPWIDPRVPVEDNPSGLTVPEQNTKVEELVALFSTAQEQWVEVQTAPDILTRMVLRRDLVASLAVLEDELRKIDKQGLITFTPAVKRLQNEVREPLEDLRKEIDQTSNIEGPTREEMEQVLATMHRNIGEGHFDLALQAFAEIKNTLDLVQGDPAREELAAELLVIADDADILREFDSIELAFGGQAIIEGRPPVVILNGKQLKIGDVIDPGMEILDIQLREVTFAFRGVELTRKF
tara:strand:+ start:16608 stop:18005 length:1398 start_codon:yes stop_codon:yes gene_type:complete